MRVAIAKIEGVKSVNVSLEQGLAEIELESYNRVVLEEIRKVVRDNGFTPKAAEVVVVGRLVERDGAPALALEGTDAVYAITGVGSGSTKLMGERVRIAGRIPEAKGKAPQRTIVADDIVTAPP